MHLVATQPSKSSQIEISPEMFEQFLVHQRLSCWAGLHLRCRAASEISCLTLFPSRRCLICTSLLQQGIIKTSAEEAPQCLLSHLPCKFDLSIRFLQRNNFCFMSMFADENYSVGVSPASLGHSYGRISHLVVSLKRKINIFPWKKKCCNLQHR